jgi:DNA-binding response OmpR family regulator
MTVSDPAAHAILLVEDEVLIAMQVEDMLIDAGFGPVECCADIDSALTVLTDRPVRAALLDISLGGTLVWPVADALADRAIPFVLCSGQGQAVPARHRGAPSLDKPYAMAQLAAALNAIGVNPR